MANVDIVEGGLIRETVSRIPVAHDLEIRVSIVSTEDDPPMVEIRNYIPSLCAYTRGIVLPTDLCTRLIGALEDANERR